MKRIRIVISSGTYALKKEYTIDVESFEEFKTELLKRFGNLTGTREANRHKEKVKESIRTANSLEEIAKAGLFTGWHFDIRIMKEEK